MSCLSILLEIKPIHFNSIYVFFSQRHTHTLLSLCFATATFHYYWIPFQLVPPTSLCILFYYSLTHPPISSTTTTSYFCFFFHSPFLFDNVTRDGHCYVKGQYLSVIVGFRPQKPQLKTNHISERFDWLKRLDSFGLG